jgi:DNA-binding NtrC family response regulator
VKGAGVGVAEADQIGSAPGALEGQRIGIALLDRELPALDAAQMLRKIRTQSPHYTVTAMADAVVGGWAVRTQAQKERGSYRYRLWWSSICS